MHNMCDGLMEGKYTLETFAEKNNLTKQSALNLLSKLKKQGLVQTSGGGKQKRLYTITKTPKKESKGFFYIINKFSPEKIHPLFEHNVYGRYDVEKAIIDGILLQKKQKNIRIRRATYYLFNHVKNWKKLFDNAKKNNVTKELLQIYEEARKTTKCRTMPKKYEKIKQK
jgi:DNA-binding PadR family transcriptional regulator